VSAYGFFTALLVAFNGGKKFGGKAGFVTGGFVGYLMSPGAGTVVFALIGLVCGIVVMKYAGEASR
jgi:hypothetical protein